MDNLNYHALTFTGRRQNNQDSCKVIELGNNSYFLAVADGMGGVAGGQVASNLVITEAEKILSNEFHSETPPNRFKQILEKVFIASQKVIQQRIKEEPQLAGMGTTLSALLVSDNKFVWGNLGDSRIYLLRENVLKQITEDHTYIEDYKKNNEGEIPQYIIDQYSHYLLRSVDGGSDEADIFPLESDYETLKEKDTFLICSDGLITNKVDTADEFFKDQIVGTKNLKTAAQNLIASAFYDGSNDNISVILAEYGSTERKKLNLNNYYYPPSDNPTHIVYEDKLRNLVFTALFILTVLLLVFAFFKGN